MARSVDRETLDKVSKFLEESGFTIGAVIKACTEISIKNIKQEMENGVQKKASKAKT